MTKESKVDLKERFIELRAEGRSYAKIAAELNVSKPTLITWSKELTLELQNARAIRLDELFERFAVAKAKRVEVFGKRLEEILTELDKRELKGVRTETLLVLALKYVAMLREDHIPLKLSVVENIKDREMEMLSALVVGVKTWEG